VQILRKPELAKGSGASTIADTAPLKYDNVSVSTKMFTSINVQKPEPDGNNV